MILSTTAKSVRKATTFVRPPHLGRSMDMRMKINPIPKGLDDRDDAGRKRAFSQEFEVSGQGPEGQATEIAEKQ